SDPRFESAVALVHQRFSTNTFPSCKLVFLLRRLRPGVELGNPDGPLAEGRANALRSRIAAADDDYMFGAVNDRLLR
ncbi:hypothetical protein ACCS56_38090, partial [Rhizobium ruizarguesonis]